MDQNRLPGLESGGVDQRLPCCGGSERNGGGLLKADPFRFNRGFVFLRDGKLGVSALLTKTEISVNRIARFEFGNLGADFLHHPGHIETRDEWMVFAPKTAGPNRSIDRIHRCSHRANQNFIVLWVPAAARLHISTPWAHHIRERQLLSSSAQSIEQGP